MEYSGYVHIAVTRGRDGKSRLHQLLATVTMATAVRD